MYEHPEDLPAGALRFAFLRSSGPGGQNVNKVETGVQLHVDLDRLGLSQGHRARLERLAGSRLTRDGALLIEATRFRTQGANRRDAVHRLLELLRDSAKAPRKRVPTRVPAGVRRKRLERKQQRGAIKRTRKPPRPDD